MNVSGSAGQPIPDNKDQLNLSDVSFQDKEIKELFNKFKGAVLKFNKGEMPLVQYRQALLRMKNAIKHNSHAEDLRNKIDQELDKNKRVVQAKPAAQPAEIDSLTNDFIAIRADWLNQQRPLSELKGMVDLLCKKISGFTDAEKVRELKGYVRQLQDTISQELQNREPLEESEIDIENAFFEVFKQSMFIRSELKQNHDLAAFSDKVTVLIEKLEKLKSKATQIEDSSEKTRMLARLDDEIKEQQTFIKHKQTELKSTGIALRVFNR